MYCTDINKYIYIYIPYHIRVWYRTYNYQLGARPLEGRGFFVINGVSWIIFDVLVQIEICLMWYLRPLTPYSGAVFQKQAFRLDETSIFAFFADSETNSTWHVLRHLLTHEWKVQEYLQ